jgi:mannose-6-phosphate isomerase-like protein (cupin superfamily)
MQTMVPPVREEKLVFGEVTVVIKVSAEDSDGAMTVLEEVPPMVDTPLHVHSREDELFYILEGEHIVQRGEAEFSVRPGDAVASSGPSAGALRGQPPRRGRSARSSRVGA